MSNTIYVFPWRTMPDLTKRVGVRLRPKDLQLLKTICEARGENTSTFLRRGMRRELARLSYLTPEEKKALEITTKEDRTE